MSTVEVGLKLKGEYRLQVFGEDGAEKTDTGFFDNIITNGFFDSYLSSGGSETSFYISHCAVGNGVSAPAAGNTSISQLGTRAAIFSSSQANTGNVNTATIQYRFGVSAVVGTISEVGIFSLAGASGVLSSRTLIKDISGVATTITLITGDTLYVTWRCSVTCPSTDVTGTISIGGVNYNYAMRAAKFSDTSSASPFSVLSANSGASSVGGNGVGRITAFATQTLGSINAAPSGTAFASYGPVTGVYTIGSLFKELTYTILPAEGNAVAGGFGSLVFSSGGLVGWQMSLAAVSGGGLVPKDATKTFTITIRYTYGR